MATKMLQLNLDENLENASLKLFSSLGLDMTGAITLFLKQCIICEGLPFNSEITKPEVIDAMLDAKKVSQDPNVKAYDSFSEAILDMETEDDEDDDEEDEESTNSNVKSSYKNNVEKMTLFNEI